jgi:hypothetical protein
MKETAVTAAAKPSEDRSYNERYAMAKVEHHKQADKTRACSYCSGESHTRRTCASLKAHVVTRNALETRWRRGIAKALAESPVKIGAFVEWTTWQGAKVTAIITGLNLERFKEKMFGVFSIDSYGNDISRHWINYTVLSVAGPNDGWYRIQEGQNLSETVPFTLNKSSIFKVNPFDRDENHYGTLINILSEGVAPMEFPESWLNGADAVIHLEAAKRVSLNSFDEKHETLKVKLDSMGF